MISKTGFKRVAFVILVAAFLGGLFGTFVIFMKNAAYLDLRWDAEPRIIRLGKEMETTTGIVVLDMNRVAPSEKGPGSWLDNYQAFKVSSTSSTVYILSLKETNFTSIFLAPTAYVFVVDEDDDVVRRW